MARVVVFAAMVTVAIVVACGGSNDGGGDQPETTEYKLAVINADGYVAPDDPIVAQFRQVLADLDGKCPDTAEQIGDYAVSANKMLNDKGVSETLLETMQYVRTSVAGLEVVNESCAGAFALWVTGRTAQ